MGTIHALNAASMQAAPSQRTPPTAQPDSPQARKLRMAATEFESMLLSSWWSAMKQSGLPGGEDASDPGKETLDQMGMQAMSAAVANGGGIGIAKMLVHVLLPSTDAPAISTANASRAAVNPDKPAP
jgi:Rod binding domain-containing protein